jgi:hypothetical protein
LIRGPGNQIDPGRRRADIDVNDATAIDDDIQHTVRVACPAGRDVAGRVVLVDDDSAAWTSRRRSQLRWQRLVLNNGQVIDPTTDRSLRLAEGVVLVRLCVSEDGDCRRAHHRHYTPLPPTPTPPPPPPGDDDDDDRGGKVTVCYIRRAT